MTMLMGSFDADHSPHIRVADRDYVLRMLPGIRKDFQPDAAAGRMLEELEHWLQETTEPFVGWQFE